MHTRIAIFKLVLTISCALFLGQNQAGCALGAEQPGDSQSSPAYEVARYSAIFNDFYQDLKRDRNVPANQALQTLRNWKGTKASLEKIQAAFSDAYSAAGEVAETSLLGYLNLGLKNPNDAGDRPSNIRLIRTDNSQFWKWARTFEVVDIRDGKIKSELGFTVLPSGKLFWELTPEEQEWIMRIVALDAAGRFLTTNQPESSLVAAMRLSYYLRGPLHDSQLMVRLLNSALASRNSDLSLISTAKATAKDLRRYDVVDGAQGRIVQQFDTYLGLSGDLIYGIRTFIKDGE